MFFDLTPAELATHKPVFRTFEAFNDHDAAVAVTGISLTGSKEDRPCEASGFKIMACQSFIVAPKESYQFEVSFLPDFSVTSLYNIQTQK